LLFLLALGVWLPDKRTAAGEARPGGRAPLHAAGGGVSGEERSLLSPASALPLSLDEINASGALASAAPMLLELAFFLARRRALDDEEDEVVVEEEEEVPQVLPVEGPSAEGD
jgi:hypothetical protein